MSVITAITGKHHVIYVILIYPYNVLAHPWSFIDHRLGGYILRDIRGAISPPFKLILSCSACSDLFLLDNRDTGSKKFWYQDSRIKLNAA